MNRIVLMYHDVYKSMPTESGLASDLYKIDIETFDEHLTKIVKLKNDGYDITLTFDDGGSSFYEPISNLLDKFGLKGVFFISTQYIDKPGFLTKNQILDIFKRGHLIGSHSHSHPDNMASLDANAIKEEWEISVRILSDIIKAPVKIASIPNGYQSSEILNNALQCSIEDVYTSCPTIKVKTYGPMRLHGRYVVLSRTKVDDLEKLCKNNFYRKSLYLKYVLLSIPKYLLGDKYEAIKNLVIGINK